MKTILALAAAALALLPVATQAARIKSIHSFCAQADCTDGAQPWSAPVTDGAGNWYGTTGLGGAKGSGTIYRMAFDGAHWKYTRLYAFCTDKKCTDGSGPHGRLVIDTQGNLYGVANSGGAHAQGTVFELMPSGGSWTFKTLYDFCALKNCTDGAAPITVTLAYQGAQSGAPYDGKSALFGSTGQGGANNAGSVFKLTLSHGKWTHKVVHDFCAAAMCKDGFTPYTGVTVDGSGNLFGVTSAGGAYGRGTAYEVAPHGTGYTYTVLHSFCADQDKCLADGATPIAVPVMDGMGNLYGSSFSGGAGLGAQGTVWKIAPNGVHSKFTKLHDFCAENACTDGSNPFTSLVIDADGHLLGTTYFGGDMNLGTLFRLTGGALKTYVKLVSFGTAVAPGGAPLGGLTPDGATYLGTTAMAGTNGQGDFYRFTP